MRAQRCIQGNHAQTGYFGIDAASRTAMEMREPKPHLPQTACPNLSRRQPAFAVGESGFLHNLRCIR